MTETAKNAKQRDRSPSYPIIPLETALRRLVAFESHFKRTAARPEKVGEGWGIKAKAYADRTLAALRYFGLIDYQGTGKDRSAVISDEGWKYLRAQQETMKREVIRAAALRPRQIAKFRDHWGTDRPADPACLDELVFSYGFSDAGARDFLKVYDDTISFAGLSNSDKIDRTDNGDENEEDDSPVDDHKKAAVGDLVQWTSGGANQFAYAKRLRAVSEDEQWVFVEGEETGLPMNEIQVVEKGPVPPTTDSANLTPPILPLEKEWHEERLLDDEGQEILIRYKGEATRGRYEFIRDYLDFKIKRLKPKG